MQVPVLNMQFFHIAPTLITRGMLAAAANKSRIITRRPGFISIHHAAVANVVAP